MLFFFDYPSQKIPGFSEGGKIAIPITHLVKTAKARERKCLITRGFIISLICQ